MTPADYNSFIVYINTLNVIQNNYAGMIINPEETNEIFKNSKVIDDVINRLMTEGEKYINLYEIHNAKMDKQKIKVIITLRFLVKKIKSFLYNDNNAFMENLLMMVLLDETKRIAFSKKELDELTKIENFKLAMDHYLQTRKDTTLFRYKL